MLDSLTPREHEVLRLMAKGLTNAEIGKQLCIEEKSTRKHGTNIFDKLNVRNRVEAAALLWEEQMARLETENKTLRQLLNNENPEVNELKFHLMRATTIVAKMETK